MNDKTIIDFGFLIIWWIMEISEGVMILSLIQYLLIIMWLVLGIIAQFMKRRSSLLWLCEECLVFQWNLSRLWKTFDTIFLQRWGNFIRKLTLIKETSCKKNIYIFFLQEGFSIQILQRRALCLINVSHCKTVQIFLQVPATKPSGLDLKYSIYIFFLLITMLRLFQKQFS